MIVFLLLVIMGLIAAIYYLSYVNRMRRRELTNITCQLEESTHFDDSQLILVRTDDAQLIELLNQLNQFVESNRAQRGQFVQMEQSMKRMLSNISHDVKTPLTVIAGYVEMLQMQPEQSEAERVRILTQVEEKVNEMIAFIQTFFDLAKLEAGDVEIELNEVNATEVCKQQLLRFYDMIESRGLEVEIDLPDHAVYVLANVDALQRVFDNLISNVLRYGADGGVIGLRLIESETTVSLELFDRGVGIRESDQELIFERMFTLEESRNKNFQGSGLGLTITKRLIEQMQGSITVHSIPYEKTSFTCTLKRTRGGSFFS